MQITIIASGSRGDVQPYVALGKGLQETGYRVRLVTHQNYHDLVTSNNLELFPVAGNIQDIAQSSDMRALLEKGNFLAILAEMAKAAMGGAVGLAQAGLEACKGTDLLIAGLGGIFPAIALAEKFNIPLIQAYYIPFTATREVPSFAVPFNMPGIGNLINPFSYFIARQMIWQGFRRADTLSRKEVLNLSPAPFFGPFGSPSIKGMPVLYGYSPQVIPRPSDWPENIHVTGYWFLDEGQDWQPPADLVKFLEAGPAPVLIGFGSMSTKNPRAMAELILEAVALSEQRAIILSGWGGMGEVELPDSVYLIESVPHSWLFPRVSAVAHHGGAGTTSAGLRAGVPSIIIPFFGDQPYWGRQVERLGVGPKPIPRRKLTAGKLAAAIQTAVTDQGMRQRAALLGETIRSEDGVGYAVEVIRQTFERYSQ